MNRFTRLFLILAFPVVGAVACSLCPIAPQPVTEAPTRPSTGVLTQTPYQESTPVPVQPPRATPAKEPTPEGPTVVDTWTRPADGMVMVYVPAGEFLMGSTEADVEYALGLCEQLRETAGGCEPYMFADERPTRSTVLAGFWIDQTEVTNAQYGRCVEAGACEASGCWDDADFNAPEQPVACVDWYQAQTYCRWAGGRLPRESEWEYAARGPEGLRYPWGDAFDGTRLNYCDANCPSTDWADQTFDDGYAHTAPVGSFPGDASWCGALDMAGNVSEWVANQYWYYSSDRYVGASERVYRVVRGGCWWSSPSGVRCTSRDHWHPSVGLEPHGFRCARDAEGPTGVPEPVGVNIAQEAERVPASTFVALGIGWVSDTPEQVADFVAAMSLRITLDGDSLPYVEGYWGEIEEYGDEDDDGDMDYASWWLFPVGVLSPGEHWVDTRGQLRWTVTDGFDLDEDGLPDEYSGTLWQYLLEIVVEE